jgi:hypothetical protein
MVVLPVDGATWKCMILKTRTLNFLAVEEARREKIAPKSSWTKNRWFITLVNIIN